MNKKTKSLFIVFIVLFFIFVSLMIYLNTQKTMSSLAYQKKNIFVSLVKTSSLSFYNENIASRDKSRTNLFDIYGYDASLRENSKDSFVYANAKIINPHPKDTSSLAFTAHGKEKHVQ